MFSMFHRLELSAYSSSFLLFSHFHSCDRCNRWVSHTVGNPNSQSPFFCLKKDARPPVRVPQCYSNSWNFLPILDKNLNDARAIWNSILNTLMKTCLVGLIIYFNNFISPTFHAIPYVCMEHTAPFFNRCLSSSIVRIYQPNVGDREKNKEAKFNLSTISRTTKRDPNHMYQTVGCRNQCLESR